MDWIFSWTKQTIDDWYDYELFFYIWRIFSGSHGFYISFVAKFNISNHNIYNSILFLLFVSISFFSWKYFSDFWKSILPESARWLISKGRFDEVEKILRRIAMVNRQCFDSDAFERLKETQQKVSWIFCSSISGIFWYL